MSMEENKAIVRRYLEALDQKNFDAIKEHPYDPHAYLNVHAEGWEKRLGSEGAAKHKQ